MGLANQVEKLGEKDPYPQCTGMVAERQRLPGPRKLADKVLRGAFRKLDALLRRCEHIKEFTDDAECILRISQRPAGHRFVLKDQTAVEPGDLIGELHLWNEHIVPMGSSGADVQWALQMHKRMRRSLFELANQVQSNPQFSSIRVFRAETALGSEKQSSQTDRIGSFYGFEVRRKLPAKGMSGWWINLGKSLHLWGMMRTFNLGAIKNGKLLKPEWFEFWMTREALIERYGKRK